MRLAVILILAFSPMASAQILTGASVGDDGLEVEIEAGGTTGAQLVVTHEDPIDGTVVDRVVPIDLIPEGGVKVRVKALPQDTPFAVHIVRPDVEVPLVHNATRVLDGGLAALAPIGSLDAPPVPPLGRDGVHRVAGYPVTDDRWWWGPFQVVALPDGPIAFLWRATDDPDDYDGAALRVAWSQDGGRTWGANTTLLDRVNHNVDGFDAVALDGAVWVAARDWDGALRLVRTSAPDASMTLPDDGVGTHQLAAIGDAVLLATLSQRWGQEPDPAITFRQVDEGGWSDAVELATPEAYGPAGFQMAAQGHRAIVAYAAGDAEQRTVRYHWSDDGGTSWTSAADVGLEPSTFHVDGVLVDATGVGHIIATDWGGPVQVGECTTSRPVVHHVRIGLDGDVTVQTMSGPDGAVASSRVGQEAMIAASGPRIWLFFLDLEFGSDCTGQGIDWAVESMDLGRSWGPGYRIERTTAGPVQPSSVTVLPDGVPAFAASFLYGPGDARLSFLPMFERIADEKTTLTEVIHLPLAAHPDGERDGATGSDGDAVSSSPGSSTALGPAPQDPSIPGPSAVVLPVALAWWMRRRR